MKIIPDGAYRDEDGDEPIEDFVGLYWGIITEDRGEGENVNKVKVHVPTLIEPDAWASVLQLGAFPLRGSLIKPPKGSTVLVGFIMGDVDDPIVLGGYTSQMPPRSVVWDYARRVEAERDLQSAEDAPDVVPIFRSAEWLVQVVSLAAKSQSNGTFEGQSTQVLPKSTLQIVHKDKRILFEMDGVDGSVTLRGQAAVNIVADGIVSIEGVRIQINGRIVLPGTKPI